MSELSRVYRIESCRSKVEPVRVPGKVTADALAAFIADAAVEAGEGYAVCWQHHSVTIGKVFDGVLSFCINEQPLYSRHLIRMRVFSREREYHIWKSGTQFNYRKRYDGQGDAVEYVEALQPLWGTQAQPGSKFPGWSCIFEQRGIELFVPFSGLSFKGDKRLSIVTRNYISYNDIGQAGYVDCRFVKFDGAGGEG